MTFVIPHSWKPWFLLPILGGAWFCSVGSMTPLPHSWGAWFCSMGAWLLLSFLKSITFCHIPLLIILYFLQQLLLLLLQILPIASRPMAASTHQSVFQLNLPLNQNIQRSLVKQKQYWRINANHHHKNIQAMAHEWCNRTS